MTRTMVPEGGLEPLRRLREAVRPASGDRAEEHLHYDRAARTWRTHAELGAQRLVAQAYGDRALQEIA